MSVNEDALLDESEGHVRRDRRRRPAGAGIQSVFRSIDRTVENFNQGQEERTRQNLARMGQLTQLEQDVFNDHFAESEERTREAFRSFFDGVEAGLKRKFVVPRLGPGYRNSDLMFAFFKDAEMERNLLRHPNGSSVLIQSNKIEFNPSTAEFGLDDAFEMALAAAHNKDMLGHQVKLTGNAREQAMLRYAIEQVNVALATEHQISVKTPKIKLPELDFQGFTLNTYLKKMGALPADPSITPEPTQASPQPAPQTRAPVMPVSGLAEQLPPIPVPAPPPVQLSPSPAPSAQSFVPNADEVIFIPEDMALEAALLMELNAAAHPDAPRSAYPRTASANAEGAVSDADISVPRQSLIRLLYNAARPDVIPPADLAQRNDVSTPTGEAQYNEIDFNADEVFNAEDGLPSVSDHDVLNYQPISHDLIRVSDEEWDINLQNRTQQLLAKGKSELHGIADALLDYVNDPEIDHLPGRASGEIVMTYDDKILPFIKKRKDEPCEVYTAQIDLYENGTPPADVEYIFHEKRKQSLLHIVSITGEGYEEYRNHEFFDADLNPVFTVLQQDQWGAQQGPEVLKAAKYFLPQVTFDDDLKFEIVAPQESNPAELSEDDFDAAHPFDADSLEKSTPYVPSEILEARKADELRYTEQARIDELAKFKWVLAQEIELARANHPALSYPPERSQRAGSIKTWLGDDPVHVMPIQLHGKESHAMVYFHRKSDHEGEIVAIQSNHEYQSYILPPFEKSFGLNPVEEFYFNEDFINPEFKDLNRNKDVFFLKRGLHKQEVVPPNDHDDDSGLDTATPDTAVETTKQQSVADRKPFMSLLTGWIGGRAPQEIVTPDAVDPDFIGPPAPASVSAPASMPAVAPVLAQTEPEAAGTAGPEQTGAVDKRQPPYVARIIQDRLSAVMKRRLFGAFGVVAGASWIAAATISGTDAGATTSASTKLSDLSARVDVSPTAAERANLASLNLPSLFSPLVPRTPVTPPVIPESDNSNTGEITIALLRSADADEADLLRKSRLVNITNLHERLEESLPVLRDVWARCAPNKIAVITSGHDQLGEHGSRSRHRDRAAIDIQTINGSPEQRLTLAEATRCYQELTTSFPDLTVLWERQRAGHDHFHIHVPRAGEAAVHRIVYARQNRSTPTPAPVQSAPLPDEPTVIIIPETQVVLEPSIIASSEQEARPSPTL